MQRTIKRLDGKHAGKSLLTLDVADADSLIGQYSSALMIQGLIPMTDDAVVREADGTYTLINGWRLTVE